MNENGIINLVGGIIRQAIDDYKKVLCFEDYYKEGWMPTYIREPEERTHGEKKIVKFNAGQTRAYLDDYFKSDEFYSLVSFSGIDYKFIIKTVSKEIDEFYDDLVKKNKKLRKPKPLRPLMTIKRELELKLKTA